MTKAKLFTATFNRMMENIKEINVAEIFVAAVDNIDPEAMFDLRGRDLSVAFSDGVDRPRPRTLLKAPKTMESTRCAGSRAAVTSRPLTRDQGRLGCHSRASFWASAICAGVMSFATSSLCPAAF